RSLSRNAKEAVMHEPLGVVDPLVRASDHFPLGRPVGERAEVRLDELEGPRPFGLRHAVPCATIVDVPDLIYDPMTQTSRTADGVPLPAVMRQTWTTTKSSDAQKDDSDTDWRD